MSYGVDAMFIEKRLQEKQNEKSKNSEEIIAHFSGDLQKI